MYMEIDSPLIRIILFPLLIFSIGATAEVAPKSSLKPISPQFKRRVHQKLKGENGRTLLLESIEQPGRTTVRLITVSKSGLTLTSTRDQSGAVTQSRSVNNQKERSNQRLLKPEKRKLKAAISSLLQDDPKAIKVFSEHIDPKIFLVREVFDSVKSRKGIPMKRTRIFERTGSKPFKLVDTKIEAYRQSH